MAFHTSLAHRINCRHDPAKGNTMIQGNIFANFCCFANHHTHAMIHKKAFANFGARMDFNTCKPARNLHDQAGYKPHTDSPHRMRKPIGKHYLKAGINKYRRKSATCRRIAFHDRIAISFQFCQHSSFLYILRLPQGQPHCLCHILCHNRVKKHK